MAFTNHFVVIAAFFRENVLLIIAPHWVLLYLPCLFYTKHCHNAWLLWQKKVPQLGNSLKTSSCELSLARRCCFYRHFPHWCCNLTFFVKAAFFRQISFNFIFQRKEIFVNVMVWSFSRVGVVFIVTSHTLTIPQKMASFQNFTLKFIWNKRQNRKFNI